MEVLFKEKEGTEEVGKISEDGRRERPERTWRRKRRTSKESDNGYA